MYGVILQCLICKVTNHWDTIQLIGRLMVGFYYCPGTEAGAARELRQHIQQRGQQQWHQCQWEGQEAALQTDLHKSKHAQPDKSSRRYYSTCSGVVFSWLLYILWPVLVCDEGPSLFAELLKLLSVLLILSTMPFSLFFIVKVVQVSCYLLPTYFFNTTI